MVTKEKITSLVCHDNQLVKLNAIQAVTLCYIFH